MVTVESKNLQKYPSPEQQFPLRMWRIKGADAFTQGSVSKTGDGSGLKNIVTIWAHSHS